MDKVFVPVTCPHCQRVSIFTLSVAHVAQQLEGGAPIELRCVYDEFAWSAQANERARIAKLLREKTRVAACSWLRLRNTAEHSLRIP